MNAPYLAETLRYSLLTLQFILVAWMIRSNLYRNLPIWTAWIACEALSRLPFDPGGNYWHLIWRPIQPALLFLLACAAVEARYQVIRRPIPTLAVALGIAPAGICLDLPALMTFRMLVYSAVACFLIRSAGSPCPRWHARILAGLCAAGAMTGWHPRKDNLWWELRAVYFAVYCAACLGWIFLFNLRDPARRGEIPSSTRSILCKRASA